MSLSSLLRGWFPAATAGDDGWRPPSDPDLPACPDPRCPGAEADLELFGPRAAPELVYGHCERCGASYYVREAPIGSGHWEVIGRIPPAPAAPASA